MTTQKERARAESRDQLREKAEKLIREGAAVASDIGGGHLGVEALELLYRRASNPEFAADALKLLHELQTHQVELDLLVEQILASEREATAELVYYRALFRNAPTACVVVDRGGQLMDSNLAAATLLGIPLDHAEGQTLAQYLAPLSRKALASMLHRVETMSSGATCLVRLADRPEYPLSINARVGPTDDSVMLAISHSGDADANINPF
ncbi:MAG: PAS domain-containing protein [Natronospirillum sp.]|uniref:PAS domain-containing protein n=1 Tax=Natronospirillum sp. TaxID=2812955 RepID=UPI0025DE7D5A|nr:PAS domain-containing protein [Natronospirillum sp.]MCH8550839.1 PAS domain-containing protein [Natronospirillum sp.]